MANFKTHIGWGTIIGVVVIVFASIYSVLHGAISMGVVFVAVMIGSFLPDMDMDDGVPFQILFGLLGVSFSGVIFYDLYTNGMRDAVTLSLVSLASFVGVRFVIGEIFMRFTNHRGIWHSLPAAALWGIGSVRMMEHSAIIDDVLLNVIGASIMIGYVGHLILDEVYASVNLSGHSLFPKRSLGSALKLRARSKIATALVYGCIIYLIIF